MYCAASDLIDKFGEDDLILLTKRKGSEPNKINVPVLDRAIIAAEAEINSSLEGRYPLPLPTVPLMLQEAAVDIAYYNLHTRIQDREHPALIQYNRRKKYLDGVAAGTLSLGLDRNDAVAVPADTVQTVSGRNDFGGVW